MYKEKYAAWYTQHREAIYRDYFQFLRFPSISTLPEHVQDVRKAAAWLCDYLNKKGLAVELWETPGHPVVFAQTPFVSGAPTVLIYGHYDVQPVDPLELWHTDPFDPVVKDGAVFARGALDNKGQCFYAIQAVLAYMDVCKGAHLNIKLFIEGEEESGSEGTEHIVLRKKEALQADHLWVVDMNMLGEGKPALTLGVRGLVTMDLCCRTGLSDKHSGMYGGIARNPHRELTHILAGIWDEKGRIVIPGFYDDVLPMTDEDSAFLKQHFDSSAYEASLGEQLSSLEAGYTHFEAVGTRPCLEINGWHGGYMGAGFKTVIPKEAHLKLSCRLVPEQNPQRIAENIEAFFKQRAPSGVDISLTMLHGAVAYRAPLGNKSAQLVAAAFAEVFSAPCSYLFSGGSIPIVTLLAKVSGADALLMGVGLASDCIHAPNEHFHLERFDKGFLSIAYALFQLKSEFC